MRPESDRRPAWAEAERRRDLAWIIENLDVLWPAAQLGHTMSGRGAIYIAATDLTNDEGHVFWYANQDMIKESGDSDTIRMVAEYDPRSEMVTVFLKSERRVSTYRIAVAGR